MTAISLIIAVIWCWKLQKQRERSITNYRFDKEFCDFGKRTIFKKTSLTESHHLDCNTVETPYTTNEKTKLNDNYGIDGISTLHPDRAPRFTQKITIV